MTPSQDKIQKLAYVAQQYYLEDRKQSDVCHRNLAFPAPLSADMLREARELGVVRITVSRPETHSESAQDRLRQTSSIRDCVLVPDGEDDNATNQSLSQGADTAFAAVRLSETWIGWGHLIGQLVMWLEENPQFNSSVTDICPLVGNASIPARNYQSNENVRLIAQQLGAVPHFIYLPALPESVEEKQLLCSTEIYRKIQTQWAAMDTALVNIGNYPSSPDFGFPGPIRRSSPKRAHLRPSAGLLL